MKTRTSVKVHLGNGTRACLLIGALLVGFCGLAQAGDTNSPPMTQQQYFEGGTNTYNNWIELGVGGFMTKGNQAQAEELEHWKGGAFGGIEDLHIQGNAFTNTTFTLDGHSIFDDHDYQLKFRLEHPYLWYLQFDAENFRTWYNDAGGYYPPTGTEYSGASDALTLDRGKISIAGGLTPENAPAISFQYTHSYRHGDKSSTIWGPVHPDPVNSPTTVRGLYPSFYGIDETVDAFDLNVKQHIKTSDLGLGLHYEHGDLNDALYSTMYAGEPVQRDVSNRQGTTYDLFSVNTTSETWIKDNLYLSTGFMFANLDNDFSGSQIYGDAFNMGYSPSPLNTGLGYYDLSGGSHMQEYVMDLNLMSKPLKTLTIVPAIRVQKEGWNANSSGTGTLLNFNPEPFNSQSSRDVIDVCESLDLRYTGITNWVFFARGEWDEGDGDLSQRGGLSQINGIGVAAITNVTDDSRLFQKYSAGLRWYPLYNLTFDLGGYYKNDKYDYNHVVDSDPNNYPGFLIMQGFETFDGNCRLTYRPLQNVTLVGRYEYQWSTIDTTPDAASGLSEAESSRMFSHIIAADIGWVPWSRLSLQAGFNYVLSETKTPASDYTQAILNAQNNYWMLDFCSGIVLDDKTDLNLAYYYYQADDYQDNSYAGLPLGSGAYEHGVTATLTRRLTSHLRLNLKYGYYNYDDSTSGGYNNFETHLVFASLQYRF